MRKFRRFVSFAVMLPVWPFALLGAIIHDVAEVSNVIESFKTTWRQISEE